MNYFKWHIGDYARDTDHLSWDEDMAYTRLMRVYYRDEKPLPLERRQIYRLARAQSAKERKAVDTVLAEFFQQQTDGWHNKRCDEEIRVDKAFIEQQRAAAQSRWKGRNGSGNGHANGNAAAMPSHMPPHTSGIDPALRPQSQVGIDPAIPPTPTPTPTPNIPTPTPSQEGVVRHRRSEARAEKDAALEVWDRLTKSDGADPPRDAKLQAAIDAVGGWTRIQMRESGIDAQRIRRDFCDAYRAQA